MTAAVRTDPGKSHPPDFLWFILAAILFTNFVYRYKHQEEITDCILKYIHS